MAELMKKTQEKQEAARAEAARARAAQAQQAAQRAKADNAQVRQQQQVSRSAPQKQMNQPPQSRPPMGYGQQMPQRQKMPAQQGRGRGPGPRSQMSGPPGGRARPPVQYHGHQQRQQQQQMRHNYAPPQVQRKPPFDFFTILEEGELFGKVRKVFSGDYLLIEILRKKQGNSEDREFKRVTLSDIIAPRIAKNESQCDVLFAWESREFLRRLLIHSIVILKLESPPQPKNSKSKTPLRGGDWGTVLFRPNCEDERITEDRSVWKDVAEILVRRGMVDVKVGAVGDRAEHLRGIQQDATDSMSGKWEPKPENVRKDDKTWLSHHHRQVEWTPDPDQIFKEYHGKPVKAIIEDVREGSCVRCEILCSERPIKTKIIWLELSGVQCPPTPKPLTVQKKEHKGSGSKGPFKPEVAKPYSNQAKMETMIRLLHRDVDVVIEAIDTQKNLYGTVTFHRNDRKRDIATYLLANGLAKVVPWTATVSGKLEQFRHLESQAKQKQKNIWSLEENQKDSMVGVIRRGTVVEVTSGDSFYVKEEGSDPSAPPKRLFLASVQAPRNRGRVVKPFFYESKEFVRKALIQKQISYELEYCRPAFPAKRKGNEDDFEYVTVTYDKNGNGQFKNLNHELVQLGYARVLQHRKREPRSKDYVSLLDAEKDAKLQDLRIHNQTATSQYLEDFTTLPSRPRRRKGRDEDGDQKMADYQKEQTNFLKRAQNWAKRHQLCESIEDGQERRRRDRDARDRARKEGKNFQPSPVPKPKRIAAVVEYVYTADRIKMQLVEPRAMLNLILSGIDVKGTSDQGKKFAEEATKEIRKMLTQREVKIEIEKIDRNANFIGNLYTQDGQDISVYLLEKGLAKLFQRQNQRGGASVRGALKKAEDLAKENRAGYWENYVPEEKEPEENVENAEAKNTDGGDEQGRRRGAQGRQQGQGGRPERKKKERRPERAKNMTVQVTTLNDCVTFYGRPVKDPRAEMIESYMRTVNPTTCKFNPDFKPERNKIVAGLYEDDGMFYRCRILGPGAKDNDVRLWRCDWIDFGERGDIKESGILEIEDSQVANSPPLALKFVLAGVKPPPINSDYYASSSRRFWSEIVNKTLDLKILRQNKDVRYCIVNIDGESINDKMLKQGVLRVVEGRSMREEPAYKEHLLKLQSEAKEAHVGLWEYGDLGSDEESDDGPRGGRRGR